LEQVHGLGASSIRHSVHIVQEATEQKKQQASDAIYALRCLVQDPLQGCKLDHALKIVDSVTTNPSQIKESPAISTSGMTLNTLTDEYKQRRESYQPYVAFSHVWSNGLGNARQNCLPKCQLRRLGNLASKLYNNGDNLEIPLFWIDTLCVPIEKGERTLAISMMDKVYKDAHKVLVLDEELQHATIHADFREIITRIHSSKWSQRLWTLQEAVLASKVYYQFLESAIEVDSEYKERLGVASSRMRHKVDSEVMAVHADIYSFNVWTHDLMPLLTALPLRQTSKMEDETICAASFLGLESPEVTQLMKTPPCQRMKKLLSFIKIVPRGLLFTRTPKLEDDGYRWAPKSFLSQGDQSWKSLVMAEEHKGFRDELGLYVRFPGLRLQSGFPRIDQHLPVRKHFGFVVVDSEDDHNGAIKLGIPFGSL
jgi:hypothetical protein